MTNSIKLLTIACASALLVSCVSAPTKPQGTVKIVFANEGYMRTYNVATDFGDDGKLKTGVKGTNVPVQFSDLEKNLCMDEPTHQSLQAYALKLKQRYDQLQKDCK